VVISKRTRTSKWLCLKAEAMGKCLLSRTPGSTFSISSAGTGIGLSHTDLSVMLAECVGVLVQIVWRSARTKSVNCLGTFCLSRPLPLLLPHRPCLCCDSVPPSSRNGGGKAHPTTRDIRWGVPPRDATRFEPTCRNLQLGTPRNTAAGHSAAGKSLVGRLSEGLRGSSGACMVKVEAVTSSCDWSTPCMDRCAAVSPIILKPYIPKNALCRCGQTWLPLRAGP
jgi:hypothetical protein